MDRAFKVEKNPLKIDLSGIAHGLAQQTSSRISSCSSSRSTEFQTVLDGFHTLKINEAKTNETEATKSFGENVDEDRLLYKRRNSTELTPGDVVMKFGQAPQRVRRKSLPSLGLVAVDIQCSVPTKMTNSQSFPGNMSRCTMGRELKNIPEIPKKGARKNSHFKGVTKKANKPEGIFPRGRRFSMDVRQNINTSKISQRRASCSKIIESPSKWCVKVHERSLDINDDDDRLYPHIQTRRASYAGLPSFPDQSNANSGLLPRIGRRNSLVQ